MLFKEGRYPVHQMLKHTKIGSMKNIWYDNSHWGDVFHYPADTFGGSNNSIGQILCWFRTLPLISVSCEYCVLEHLPIVSQLPWQWIPFLKWQFLWFAHGAIGLFNWVQEIVFKVVSHPCTDNRITLPHLIIRTENMRSWTDKRMERMNSKLKAVP